MAPLIDEAGKLQRRQNRIRDDAHSATRHLQCPYSASHGSLILAAANIDSRNADAWRPCVFQLKIIKYLSFFGWMAPVSTGGWRLLVGTLRVDGTCQGIERIRGDLQWTVFAVERGRFIMRQLGSTWVQENRDKDFQAVHNDEDCFGDSGCGF